MKYFHVFWGKGEIYFWQEKNLKVLYKVKGQDDQVIFKRAKAQ